MNKHNVLKTLSILSVALALASFSTYGQCPTIVVAATASPTIFCAGNSSQLTVTTGIQGGGYSVIGIPYAPDSGSGTPVTLMDDQVSPLLPIGFNFVFFGRIYSQFNICSNGFISFNANNGTGYPPSALPSTVCRNLIAGAWEDLLPPSGGTIEYFNLGTAPFRKLIVNFLSVAHYGGGSPVTMQFILYETYNYIDIQTTSMPGPTATEGIQDSSGAYYLAVPGRNNTSWTATNDAWRFSPGNSIYSYSWSPTIGLSDSTIANPVANPLISTNYTVTATDTNGCTGYTTVSVLVITPNISITATPDTVCIGSSSQLDASAVTVSTSDYSVSPIPYAPLTGTGTNVNLSDDSVSILLPIGFMFGFYGNYYTLFSISSNGFITFDSTAHSNNLNGCCAGQVLPNSAKPNNLIAAAWEDLNPATGGHIKYFNSGIFPYRRLVVDFSNVPHAPARDSVSFQIILYESTNFIEIQTTSMPGNPNGFWFNHTEGIENANGTNAVVVPGRNSNNTWTAFNDAWRFAPLSPFTYSWSPASTLSDSVIYNPVATPSATTSYTLTAVDANGCIGTADITVYTYPQPIPPVINQIGNQLYSNYSTNNQWYVGGNLISGATSQYYTPTQNGNYTVSYTDSNGCSISSSPYNYTLSGIMESSPDYNISIYPNPVSHAMFIASGSEENFEITLFDATSRKITDTYFTKSITINTTHLAPGVYFYEIRRNGLLVKNGIVVKE